MELVGRLDLAMEVIRQENGASGQERVRRDCYCDLKRMRCKGFVSCEEYVEPFGI